MSNIEQLTYDLDFARMANQAARAALAAWRRDQTNLNLELDVYSAEAALGAVCESITGDTQQ